MLSERQKRSKQQSTIAELSDCKGEYLPGETTSRVWRRDVLSNMATMFEIHCIRNIHCVVVTVTMLTKPAQ